MGQILLSRTMEIVLFMGILLHIYQALVLTLKKQQGTAG